MTNYTSLTERDLLQRVVEGNEKAFSELYYRYHHQLGAHIFRLTESHFLSQEIVQDVFLKIWQNRETLASVKSFRSYLFIVSKNQALNALKSLVRERLKNEKWEKDNLDHFELLDQKQYYYSLLDEAIDRLPPQQQRVYLLNKQHKFKYKEIAKMMNISPETVKKHLQQAISSITTFIKGHSEIIMFLIFLIFF